MTAVTAENDIGQASVNICGTKRSAAGKNEADAERR
jgi:hypothetical protein